MLARVMSILRNAARARPFLLGGLQPRDLVLVGLALAIVVGPVLPPARPVLAASGPVPLTTLPLREPVTYTTGPLSGTPVPYGNGLLASYFNDDNYSQLHHQQIDTQVNFSWGTSDPAIPGETDYQWSVVWEGYLQVYTPGAYRLILESDDDSYLQMKDSSGGLVTVINNSGIHSPPNPVTTTVTLATGRHYIRISYSNQLCCDSVISFRWQEPGAAGPVVVPSGALWTQTLPALAAPPGTLHNPPYRSGFGSVDPVHTLTGSSPENVPRVVC